MQQPDVLLEETRPAGPQDGAVLVILFSFLVPLLLVAGAFTALLSSHHSELRAVLDRERALLAAESGVDDALFVARTAGLAGAAPWTRQLGGGLAFRVDPVYLGLDLDDNDRDGAVDEPDEDVYQVTVTGSYRGIERHLVAYLGTIPVLPATPFAAMLHTASADVAIATTATISGDDRDPDGTPVSGSSFAGLAVHDAFTTTELSAQLTSTELARISGTPTLEARPRIDLDAVATRIANVADLVLPAASYADLSFGASLSPQITFRAGDLLISGASRGAGVLVVDGDLELRDDFRFEGLLVVRGDFVHTSGAVTIHGAVVQGPTATRFLASAATAIHYSSSALLVADQRRGEVVALNGWQEVSK